MDGKSGAHRQSGQCVARLHDVRQPIGGRLAGVDEDRARRGGRQRRLRRLRCVWGGDGGVVGSRWRQGDTGRTDPDQRRIQLSQMDIPQDQGKHKNPAEQRRQKPDDGMPFHFASLLCGLLHSRLTFYAKVGRGKALFQGRVPSLAPATISPLPPPRASSCVCFPPDAPYNRGLNDLGGAYEVVDDAGATHSASSR